MHTPTPPDLQSLVRLFYRSFEQLGDFTEVSGREIPQPYSRLLDHHNHMTVTVEAFHASPVDVHVLDVHRVGDLYSRRILLRRQSDQAVVQFGIVRLNLSCLEQPVRREIESESIPLGRVLIRHNVLRTVELCQLYRVTVGPDLSRLFKCPDGLSTYGRTALIYCNGEPAVELLEIVGPSEDASPQVN